MRFKWKPVASFEDVTGDLEQLEVFTGKLAVLLDSLGRSPFLQLPSTKQQIHESGSGAVTWPGGAPYATLNVTLSRTYTTVIPVVGYCWTGTAVAFAYVQNVTGAGFTIVAYCPTGNPTAGQTGSVYWQADCTP